MMVRTAVRAEGPSRGYAKCGEDETDLLTRILGMSVKDTSTRQMW